MNLNKVEARIAYPCSSKLGEGAYWDEKKNLLYWVDILNCKLYIYNPLIRQNTGLNVGEHVSAIVLRESGGIILALENSLGFLNLNTGTIEKFLYRPKEDISIRFNDGKCDPYGRFWVGTMAYDFTKGAGSLFCLDNDFNFQEKIENVTISNGLVWNKNNNKFFFIDSPTQEIQRFDYCFKTGTIKKRKIINHIPKSQGMPDGMTIDEEDFLWVALFGGGKVIRVNPNNGEIDFEVLVPAKNVTSCVFGGKDLDILFITTASIGLDKKEFEKWPDSGSLFMAKVPFRGLIQNRFNG